MGSGHEPRALRRVLVLNDHRTVAGLTAAALEAEDDLECVDTAADADEAVDKVRALEPDVVVIDIELPGRDGLAAIRRIREAREQTVVIAMTAPCDPVWLMRATAAGATGFVPRNGSVTELLAAVRHDGVGLPSRRVPMSTSPVVPAPRSPIPPVRLTARERDVLARLSSGMPPKSIARSLGISVHTCRGHVKAVLTKLDVGSQLEAVVTAQRLGILPPTGDRLAR